ncbi:hypothetical protein HanPSC8_Chr04g0172131 [Helianthus annuus]|nr:hypothetical protein HanPSC8_Chr04g0172131 [Helianthus annuus]
MADQRKLDIETSHNQAGYLSDPPAEHYDEFYSMIAGLNTCRITHALKANPIICIDMVKDFLLSAKVNRSRAGGAGSVDAKIQGKNIIFTEAIVREVLRFEDQAHYPTTFARDKVMKPLRRMSYEGEIKFGPVVHQVPAPKPLNAIVAEEHDVQFVGLTVKPEIEIENLVTNDEGTDNDVELIESEQTEVPVRELPLMISENLAALIESLKNSLRNPPPVITPIQEEQVEDDATEDAESESRKKQRVDPEPSIAEQVSPNAETEHVIQAELKLLLQPKRM